MRPSLLQLQLHSFTEISAAGRLRGPASPGAPAGCGLRRVGRRVCGTGSRGCGGASEAALRTAPLQRGRGSGRHRAGRRRGPHPGPPPPPPPRPAPLEGAAYRRGGALPEACRRPLGRGGEVARRPSRWASGTPAWPHRHAAAQRSFDAGIRAARRRRAATRAPRSPGRRRAGRAGPSRRQSTCQPAPARRSTQSSSAGAGGGGAHDGRLRARERRRGRARVRPSRGVRLVRRVILVRRCGISVETSERQSETERVTARRERERERGPKLQKIG